MQLAATWQVQAGDPSHMPMIKISPSSARDFCQCTCSSQCGREFCLSMLLLHCKPPVKRCAAIHLKPCTAALPTCTHTIQSPLRGCRAGVMPPDLYATKDHCPNDRVRTEYNSTQRAHQNVQEYESIFLSMLLASGLRVCTAGVVCAICTRLLHGVQAGMQASCRRCFCIRRLPRAVAFASIACAATFLAPM